MRCVSPVGRVSPGRSHDEITRGIAALPVRLGAILEHADRSYDLTVEEDVLLASEEHDEARVTALVRRVVEEADRLE